MAKIGIFIGTVYGNALMVGEEAQSILLEQGHEVSLFEEPVLSDWQQFQQEVALIITSTTGQGDLPDSIARLYQDIKDKQGHQPQLRYGIIALGDSSYDHFCNAGNVFDQLLLEQSARREGDVFQVDATEDPEPESVTSPWVENWGKTL